MGGSACENITGVGLGVKPDNALPAWGKVLEDGAPCGTGQLSSTGWQQLRGVGETLGFAYRKLLAMGERSEAGLIPLQVISTDTGRTAQSAAALLSGLLDEVQASSLAAGASASLNSSPPEGLHPPPPLATASVTGAGELSVVGEAAEATIASVVPSSTQHLPPPRSLSTILAAARAPISTPSLLTAIPGLTLPLPLHIIPREEDPMLWPKKAQVCHAAAVSQSEREEDIFQHQVLPEDVASWVSEASGVELDDLPTTEECADDILTRLCHGQSLPCWGGETTTTSGASPPNPPLCLSAAHAQSVIQRCDTGYAYRFSNDITRLLSYPLLNALARQFARVAVPSSKDTPGPPRLQVRSVHDTVIAPILASLALERHSTYPWPNYAARLSFEVWGSPSTHPILLRVLYNGVDITGGLPCGRGGVGGACALVDFIAHVDALISPHDTWEAACASDAPRPADEAHPPTGKKKRRQAHAPENDVGVGAGQ